MQQRDRTELLNGNSNNNTYYNYGMPTYAAQHENINGHKRDRWSNSATGVHAKLNHHHQIMPKEAPNFHNVYAIMDEQETNYNGYNNPSLLLPSVPPHPFGYGEDTPQYKKWKNMYRKSNKVRQNMLSNQKPKLTRGRTLLRNPKKKRTKKKFTPPRKH